jgi:hypothetical protein
LTIQAGQIALLPGAQVIKNANLSSMLEVFGNMPADETSAAGN